MNKRGVWRWSFVAAVALLACSVLHLGGQVARASARATPTPVPIATVNLVTLLDQLDEKKTKEGELKTYAEQMQAVVDAKIELVKQAEKDMDAAPSNKRDEFAAAYFRKAADARVEKELCDELIQRRTRQMQLELFNKIKLAAADHAKAQGYALVLCNDSTMEIPAGLTGPALQAAILSQRMLYADPEALDITDAVVGEMNKKFKAK